MCGVLKAALVVFLVSILPFNNLASALDKPVDELERAKLLRRTLQHDGIEREYFLYLPTSFNSENETPIVLMLHGYGGSATGIALETSGGFNRYAEKMGYIVVYPQGTHFLARGSADKEQFISSWNELSGQKASGPRGPLCKADAEPYPCPPECGSCGHCAWAACHDDIGFIKKLMEEIQLMFNSNAARQFLTGFSNGSMMSQRLACEMGEYWSAVALVSGRLPIGYSCAPGKPLPLLQINGMKDSSVPYDGSASSGGYFYTSVREVSETWAKAAGCEYSPASYESGYGEEDDLQCERQANCGDSKIEITSCALPERGHTWPGYPVYSGWCAAEEQQQTIAMPVCKKPDSTREIWGSQMILEFFERHRKR